jgi:nucleoside-diphosphate-sugar epimerase
VPRVLIAGCGFVGAATAKLFAREGWARIGCTHSAESAAAQQEREQFPIVAADLAELASVAALRPHGPFDAVIHCASSGRGGAEQYRRVYLEGAKNLAAVFAPATLLFTSSTSVYAQTDGGWVTEESAAEPDRETGHLLRETEDFVLSQNGIVARLAGIYGSGRSVLLRKFFDGTATIEGDGTKWINQVHRDDIASALVHLVTTGARGIFNVNDDQPLSQGELYTWLAERFGRPLPPSGEPDLNRKRGWTNKRVSNARLRAAGWQPSFPSFFDAVQNDPRLLPGLGA